MDQTVSITLQDVDTGMIYTTRLSQDEAHKAEIDSDFASKVLNVLKETEKKVDSPSSIASIASTDAETPACEQCDTEHDTYFKWPHQAILLLINEYREQERYILTGKMSQRRIWESVSKILCSHGYDVTGSQCRGKFNGMKRTFKSIKDNSRPGNYSRPWPYIEMMESLLAEKPLMNPITLASSTSHTTTESECSDVSMDNCDISVGTLDSPIKKTSDIAEAILESRRIAEENKRIRHQQTMNQRAKLLSALDKLINALQGSSQDELEYVTHETERKRKLPKLENYVENIVPAYNDQQFKSQFRLSRGTFEFVLAIIAPKLKRKYAGLPMISPEKQFLIALWRMATPDSYRSISEKLKVSRGTALSATRRVLKVLYDLAPDIIKWPSGNNVNEIWTGFQTISAFPKVIGVLDNTHINIPRVQSASYVNHKGQYSIQLQAVCDHNAHFIHCFAECAGSMHDQQVFQSSELQDWLGDSKKFPDDCHILGGTAYKLHQNVIVPYCDNGHLTPRQKNFNFCHSSARIATERAFGLLKTRFHSMKTILAMDRLDLIPMFVIACCVMHNICLSRGDEIDFDISYEAGDNNPSYQDAAPLEKAGVIKRDLICERLLMRNI